MDEMLAAVLPDDPPSVPKPWLGRLWPMSGAGATTHLVRAEEWPERGRALCGQVVHIPELDQEPWHTTTCKRCLRSAASAAGLSPLGLLVALTEPRPAHA